MKKTLFKAFGILSLGAMSKALFDTNIIKVEKIQFKTEKLTEKAEFRIMQISDFHNQKSRCQHKKVINKVEVLRPDIIVLTGDLIDRRTRNFRSVLAFVDALISIGIPIYFVSGNHEWNNPKRHRFLARLSKRKITILSNNHVELNIKNEYINLAGIEDAATEHENIEMTFSNMKVENYTILLSHSPYVINKYPDMQADLVISGHTHGGQIRLPFIGAAVSPGEGFFPKLDKGIFEWGKGEQLYVDSGVGTTRLPIRFLNQSQMTFIQISGTARG
ncbi:metallophosphoesterase [Oceanobacillus sp. FSL H7-0719]|uniref:metallophosphoesterase n=1 Tax=Oceanobacillus sp. FSL H7-0719 TaxID=2954507 RepID=UPI0032567B56